MDKPSTQLAQQLAEQCPNCRTLTTPVVTQTQDNSLLMAAYRCVMCRTDFTSIWQQGFIPYNQPPLEGMEQLSPITQDVLPTTSQPYAPSPIAPTTRNAPDGVCQSCLAQPGTPHALACPYN